MEKYEKLPRTKIWSAVAKWAFLSSENFPKETSAGQKRLKHRLPWRVDRIGKICTYICTKDTEGGIITLSPWPDMESNSIYIRKSNDSRI